jgi:hypothetical protein
MEGDHVSWLRPADEDAAQGRRQLSAAIRRILVSARLRGRAANAQGLRRWGKSREKCVMNRSTLKVTPRLGAAVEVASRTLRVRSGAVMWASHERHEFRVWLQAPHFLKRARTTLIRAQRPRGDERVDTCGSSKEIAGCQYASVACRTDE